MTRMSRIGLSGLDDCRNPVPVIYHKEAPDCGRFPYDESAINFLPITYIALAKNNQVCIYSVYKSGSD